jgi:hypothetical protein
VSRPHNLLISQNNTIVSVQPRSLREFLTARANGDATAVLKVAKVLASAEDLMTLDSDVDAVQASTLLNNLFPDSEVEVVEAVVEVAPTV